jgi:hypothetical protein
MSSSPRPNLLAPLLATPTHPWVHGSRVEASNRLDPLPFSQRPRSSAWIEQRFPKPEVGRSNRPGGAKILSRLTTYEEGGESYHRAGGKGGVSKLG